MECEKEGAKVDSLVLTDGANPVAVVTASVCPHLMTEENNGSSTMSGTASGTATQEKEKKAQRAKHKCPFPSCSASVIHLPRHMMQRHKWAKEDAAGVVNSFNLRKPKKGSEKSTLKRKICPVKHCRSVVKRIHNHLTDFHQYKRGSDIYKKCLKVAVSHKIMEISSTSEWDSTSSEERVPRKKRKVKKRGKRVVKKEKHESSLRNFTHQMKVKTMATKNA